MITNISNRVPFPRKTGSVLLLTLLVVSLLMVMVLSFVVYVRMELRTLQSRQQVHRAQANARLGAMLALARLQELTGPDQRITARGEQFDGSVDNLSRPGAVLPLEKHQWVGVWDSRSRDERDPTAKQFLGWLISGDSYNSWNAPFVSPDDADSVVLISAEEVARTEDQRVARKTRWGAEGDAFAWSIEDEGLKAQISAFFQTPGTISASSTLPGGGVIPWALPPGDLPGFAALSAISAERAGRLNRLSDLNLLGADTDTVAEHFYDYTPVSRGVLANVRDGGLRKDLTVAFERDDVFDRVFPTSSDSYTAILPDKLSQASDLQQNGYIHWNIFKDFYNLKRHISGRDGVPFVDSHYLDKRSLIQNLSALSVGTIPPHGMGPSRNGSRHRDQPYGDIVVSEGINWESPNYKHNHIGPVLNALHQSAWVEYTPPADPSDPAARANVRLQIQTWTSFFNPYNIGLMVRGPSISGGTVTGETGPRLLNYPQVYFQIPDVLEINPDTTYRTFDDELGKMGFTVYRETNTSSAIILPPGKSQVFGLERSAGYRFLGNFGPNVRDNMLSTIFRDYRIEPLAAGEHDLKITFRFDRDNTYTLLHGSNMDPPQTISGMERDFEVSQVFYAPFAWNSSDAGGFPSKVFNASATASEMNDNMKFSVGLYLRSTREPGSEEIRPLIDANIRAPWVNPRWDSSLPMNLQTPAAYANTSQGQVPSPFPLMETHPSGTGFSYMGAGTTPARGTTRVVLFDIPREDLVSLGQLQHAAAGKFSYEPSYIVGNSYANPRIPLNDWRDRVSDNFSTRMGLAYRISSAFNLYDASYLVNERIWDEFVFTTLPQIRDNYTPGEPDPDFARLLAGEDILPNPRYRPYQPVGSEFSAAVLQDQVGGEEAFSHNAGHLLVDGAFNINSTSAAAWEAFLSGTLNLPVRQITDNGTLTGFSPLTEQVRFPRVNASHGGPMDRDAPDDNYWTGFRALAQTEVRELAESIVQQVKRRGPFLSMGDFVNRMLTTGEEGRSGPLQAALDATVNQGLSTSFALEAGGVVGDPSQGAAFPGQLLQGDILQALAPLMQVRSDTFTIRAYGEVLSPDGTVTRARCEMRVQRVPDPVLSAPPVDLPSYLDELASPQSPFGRRYTILNFRWISGEEG